MLDAKVEGTCEARFDAVRRAFEANFREHDDVGAALCVTVEGETVIDLWGGYADAETARPWRRDTLVNVYSTTKGLAALCAHLLADRGELDVDRPVADYWPEFAAAGKERIPVRWLLSHRAGLAGWTTRFGAEDYARWDYLCGLLAAQAPLWEPGTASGYHALSFGHLVGEVVRRISGRSLGKFFREEVARVLGVEREVYIGLPDAEHPRAATLIPPPAARGGERQGVVDPATATDVQRAAFRAPADVGIVNSPAWRRAEIPAANGHATARGLAAVYAPLANGGAPLLSSEGVERAREPQEKGRDLVLGVKTVWALGFATSGPFGVYGPNPRAFGHDGAGGSFGMADPESRISVGWVMNRMGTQLVGDPRKVTLLNALYRLT